MNKQDINYMLKEIKKANQLSELIFNYLYKSNYKKHSLSIYRVSEINEILTNLEIDLETNLSINERKGKINE